MSDSTKKQGSKRKFSKGAGQGKEKQRYNKNFAKEQPKILNRQERKALRLERRHSRPNGEIVTETNNKLWGAGVSMNNLEAKERVERVEQILSLVEGKMVKIAVKHDVSRSLQLCVKFGSKEQRQKLFEEVKKDLVALSKNRYGHHLVLKLFQIGDDDMKANIRKKFKGKVLKLCFRNDSAKVVDLLYAAGTPAEQHTMLAEFYGQQYALCMATNQPLPSLESEMASSRATETLASMRSIIERLINKEMLMFRFSHALLSQYFKYSKQDRSTLVLELSQFPLALFHTPTGAEVLCQCISEGGAKSRKTYLKAIKGRVLELATHRSGHTCLMRSLVVVDDTVLVTKTILNEMIAAGQLKEEVMTNPYCTRVLLQVLCPGNSRHFARDQALVAPAVALKTTEDGKTEEVSTVRKPDEVRQAALLKKLLPPLMQSFAAEDITTRVKSKSASRLLYEAFLQCSAQGQCLSECQDLYSVLAEAAAQPGFLEDITAHMVLKRLLLNLKDPAPLVSALSESLLEDAATHAMSNRGAFVLMALMHAGGEDTTQAFIQVLKPALKKIKGVGRAGTDHLARAIQDPSSLSATFDRSASSADHKTKNNKRKAASKSDGRSKKTKKATTIEEKVEEQVKAKKARKSTKKKTGTKKKKSTKN